MLQLRMYTRGNICCMHGSRVGRSDERGATSPPFTLFPAGRRPLTSTWVREADRNDKAYSPPGPSGRYLIHTCSPGRTPSIRAILV